MLLKAADGLRIVNPNNKLPIDAAGIEIKDGDPNYSYWLRRLQCGDVVEVEPPQPKPVKASKVEENV